LFQVFSVAGKTPSFAAAPLIELGSMQCEVPADLQPTVKAEVERILPLLEAAGWTLNRIEWESVTSEERRVSFRAESDTGKQFHSTCDESSLPSRLTFLLGSRT
jgi:hypothetical protein